MPADQVDTCELSWNGQTVFCAGFRDGLPVFGWRRAPAGLATRRQLRALDLSEAGLDPVALLVYRHRRPFRHEEVAELFLVADARPVQPMTPGRWRQHDAMMRARRTCRTCRQVVDHCVRGPKKQCSTCYDVEGIAA
ncbi:RRQRL motif-containing zinc-binding protein [Saccharothrix lopnurensis]|uniref:RRQRL motif-containing zinc-binding protein n=1 Tax=Saccharothrix lopnurensis TaxID=1670621 RepID=A0ABW1P5G6_9PSEU